MSQKNGNRKHGRNKEFCKAYRAREQAKVNKKRHLIRHLKKHGQDISAVAAFKTLYAKSADALEAMKAYGILILEKQPSPSLP